MIKWMTLVLLSLSSVGCNSKSVAPHMKYFAAFDNSKIEVVEPILDVIAKRNNLEVSEKDPMKMKTLSQGKEAFFTALYFHGDSVLILTNVGVSGKLVFTVTDYGEIPLSDLERIANEIINAIEAAANLKFAILEER